ncbi:hypothetical protein H6F51_05280 [Cyanobacteria bacterium FACHB-DQ100]|uniref:hypothetical protein n=1 Tax=Leptolyngbya sp. DQ-M1 TaxID=2933920 RepID=UPI00199EED27|nr:hypothetical protein [Cyanobacteria bacterium FACHB-DQ100]
MQNLLVFAVVVLMVLGLISLGELIGRSLKSRNSEPVDYTPVSEAIGNGLIGAEPGDGSHFFGAIAAFFSRFLEHFLHH